MHYIIWDNETPPTFSKHFNMLLWNSYGFEDYPDAISIPKIIERFSQEFRSRYLFWVYEIGETKIKEKSLVDHLELQKRFSFWWMTAIAEKNNYAKSPQITDAIRLYALEKLINENKINSLELITCNKYLLKSIKLMSSRYKINLKYKLNKLPERKYSKFKSIYNFLPNILRAFFWLIKYFLNHSKIAKETNHSEWKNSTGNITFISYLINLDKTNIEKNNVFKNDYWTELPKKLSKLGVKTNWLHIYVNSNGSSLSQDQLISNITNMNNMDNNSQLHVTLSSFLSIKIILNTIFDLCILFIKNIGLKKKLLKTGNDNFLWPLFAKEWNNSLTGQLAAHNLLFHHLFKSSLSKLPVQKKGIYLMENQGWEYGLIHQWELNGHHCLIGYPHTVVRYWDLRYFFNYGLLHKTSSNSLPIPEKIACNSKFIFQYHIDNGYPYNKLVEVESLRYLYLLKYDRRKKNSVTDCVNILMVGDYLSSNTKIQIKMLSNVINRLKIKVRVTFRPHPACKMDLSEYSYFQLEERDQGIEKLLATNDIIYTSSTTAAAIDGYCYGLKVISFLDGNTLNLSPLRNFDDVSFVNSENELKKSILNNSKLIHKRDRKLYFNLNEELIAWLKILEI